MDERLIKKSVLPEDPLAHVDLSPPASLSPLSIPLLLALLRVHLDPGFQDEETRFYVFPLPEVLLSPACLASPRPLGPPWAALLPDPSLSVWLKLSSKMKEVIIWFLCFLGI